MNFFTLSHKGQVRPNNEDYAESFQYKWCGLEGETHSFTALILSDGMGGAAAGEYASSMTVSTVKEMLFDGLFKGDPVKFATSDLKAFITTAVVEANQRIYQKAQANPDMEGMGATLVVVFVYDEMLTIGHVGDSRAYLLREGRFKQVTRDHSFVQELIDTGKLTPEQAAKHPNKNVITRAMGVAEKVQPDCTQMPIFVGDVLLVCSDGLTGYSDERTVARLLKEKAAEPFVNLRVIGQTLIEMANGGGGGDNISVCLYRHMSF